LTSQYWCKTRNFDREMLLLNGKSLLREMRYMLKLRPLALILSLAIGDLAHAQVPAKDPSTRLREVLPPDVAQRVLARIADARAHQLPAEALENRALKFAAKGVPAADIERSVNEQVGRMDAARSALISGGRSPASDEIEAGAEAIRKGVDGSAVSLLAKTAPSGRSLAVPLFVIGSLADRGLPADQALQRVLNRLQQKASDADLEAMPGELPAQAAGGRENANNGRGNAYGRSGVNGRPATAGPPAGVPANGGKKSNPGQSHRPPKGSH
jgi:hypothetical protein